jgi:uncharacterized FlaG/YvyC family protein
MGIGPVNRVGVNAPVDAETGTGETATTLRQIVTAIRGLNSSELLGQNRELRSRRNRNGRLVIELIHSETGEILGELPPGEVVRMAAGLQRDQATEDL